MRRVASSDADRLTALLRLLAAPVVLAGEAVSSAAPERAETITTLVAVLAGYAAVVLVVVHRPTRPALLDVLLPLIDTAFAVALGLASGGVFSVLFIVFLFAPATTAFQLRPRLTLGVTVLSVAAYLAHALAHPSAQRSGAVELALARALYLCWIGAVLVCLSTLLARRERRLAELVASRRRLVQETLQAEERARARLAGDLHDGVLQSILAVRYAVEEAAEHDDGAAPVAGDAERGDGRHARRDRPAPSGAARAPRAAGGAGRAGAPGRRARPRHRGEAGPRRGRSGPPAHSTTSSTGRRRSWSRTPSPTPARRRSRCGSAGARTVTS